MEERKLNNLIGSCLEESTKKALERLEFKVTRHEVFEEGIDIKASLKLDDRTILASECLNWDKKCFINRDRFKSLIGNFNRYPKATKLLVVSHDVVTKRQKNILERHGVSVLVIGEQICDDSKNEVLLVLWKIYNFLRDEGVLSLEEITFLSNSINSFLGYPDLQTEPEDETLVDSETFKVIKTRKRKRFRPNSLNVIIKGKRLLYSLLRFLVRRG